MSKLEPKKISELPDIITAKDIAAVMRCSIGSAYDMMAEMGEFKPNSRNRRVFKTTFVSWLKQQGYKEDKQDEVNNPIQMFTGRPNGNVCTVGGTYSAGRAGTHQQKGISH